jgi:hypothetical protein
VTGSGVSAPRPGSRGRVHLSQHAALPGGLGNAPGSDTADTASVISSRLLLSSHALGAGALPPESPRGAPLQFWGRADRSPAPAGAPGGGHPTVDASSHRPSTFRFWCSRGPKSPTLLSGACLPRCAEVLLSASASRPHCPSAQQLRVQACTPSHVVLALQPGPARGEVRMPVCLQRLSQHGSLLADEKAIVASAKPRSF